MKRNFDSSEQERSNLKRKMLVDHQDYLKKQIEDKETQDVNDCRMHKTDIILNQKLLANVD